MTIIITDHTSLSVCFLTICTNFNVSGLSQPLTHKWKQKYGCCSWWLACEYTAIGVAFAIFRLLLWFCEGNIYLPSPITIQGLYKKCELKAELSRELSAVSYFSYIHLPVNITSFVEVTSMYCTFAQKHFWRGRSKPPGCSHTFGPFLKTDI